MINSIKGIVTEKSVDTLCIENNGIEWQLLVSATTLSKTPPIGENARLFIHLHHKEDMMALYGFSQREERTLFLSLISVSGVGPKVALKVLSGMTPVQFMAALDGEDIDALARAPGLGKKTAQKVLLQLKGKLAFIEEDSRREVNADSDIVESLVAMGFERVQCRNTIKTLSSEENLREEELLRRAIVMLSSSL